MNLREYDGQCVRIIDNRGDAFDGICSYNNEEYSEHEFGRAEECLQIENLLFYYAISNPSKVSKTATASTVSFSTRMASWRK